MKLHFFVFSTALLFLTFFGTPVFSSGIPSENAGQSNPVTNVEVAGLIRQAREVVSKDPQQSLVLTQKALHLLGENDKNDPVAARVYLQMGHAYLMLGEIDSSLIWFKKVLAYPSTDNNTIAGTMNFLCIVERKRGNYDQGLDYGRQAYDLFQSLDDSAGMTESMINRAKIHLCLGNRQKVMQIYMDALNYYENVKDTMKTGLIYGAIANVYMDLYQDDKGKEYYQKAIKTLQQLDTTSLYADILNNYGIVFYDEEKYDSALIYYQKAYDIYQKIGQTDAIAAASQNLGLTYVFLGYPEKGFPYLYNSLKMFMNLNLPYDMTSVMLDLGRAFTLTAQFDSADIYLKKAYHLASSTQHTYNKKEALLLLYRLAEKQGDDKKALSRYKEYVNYADSLDNIAVINNLQELEIKYQTAQRENEIIRLKDRELLDKAEKRLLVVGMAGLAVVFVLTVILFIMRRKKDKLIHRQRVLVHKKEKDLAKAEAARRQAHEKQLENELEFKTRQLASHALNMMQKNKLLHEITEDIEKRVQSSDCKSPEAMLQVKRSLQQGLNVDKDWDLFKLYFEQVNKDFFQSLKKINGKLTSNDFKLAALIKLNMSIKEMASVLNISPASLKNARYRLKKKLNLTDEESLTRVIRDL